MSKASNLPLSSLPQDLKMCPSRLAGVVVNLFGISKCPTPFQMETHTHTQNPFARSYCSKEYCPLAFLALFHFLGQTFYGWYLLLSRHKVSVVLIIDSFGCHWAIFINVCHRFLQMRGFLMPKT